MLFFFFFFFLLNLFICNVIVNGHHMFSPFVLVSIEADMWVSFGFLKNRGKIVKIQELGQCRSVFKMKD